MMTFPIYGKVKNVPNHQADIIVSNLWMVYLLKMVIFYSYVSHYQRVNMFQTINAPMNVEWQRFDP